MMREEIEPYVKMIFRVLGNQRWRSSTLVIKSNGVVTLHLNEFPQSFYKEGV